MIVVCPACGREIDTEDCVYTSISPEGTHHYLLSYAPTCECSHKITHIPDLLCHPTIIPDAILGGIMLFSIGKHNLRYNSSITTKIKEETE